MKRTNKKGFTIVELVIVIAVIAILAAVLIPNLSRLVGKANESSAMQAARNEYQAYLAEYAKDLTGNEEFVIVKGKYAFEVTGGKFNEKAIEVTEGQYDDKVDLSKVFTKTEDTTKTEGTTYYTYADGKYIAVTGNLEAGVNYYTETEEDLGSAEVAIYAK